MSSSTERKNRQAAREAGTDKKMLASMEEAAKKKKAKLRWMIGTIAVIVFIVAVLLLKFVLLSGSTKALTIGDETFSVADVNYAFANQYQNTLQQMGDYASIFGLDPSSGTAGLAYQECPMLDNGGTWRDYIMEGTVQSLTQQKALCDYAKANGIELTQEEIDNLELQISSAQYLASSYGFESAERFLIAQFGQGVTEDVFRKGLQDSALASKAFTSYMESLEYSDEQLEECYASFNGAQDIFDYAYFYIPAVSDADGTISEKAQAEAKAKADAVLEAYKTADGETELDKFTAAAESVDPEGTVSNRTGSSGSSFTSYSYAEWLQGERKTGDIDIFAHDSSGCYVVLFIGRNDNHYHAANVRHILIKAEADENGEITDEAKAAAKTAAEDILKTWQAGDKTEESFAEMAMEFSEDQGSSANGGLYENIAKGQMVEEFDAFCFGGHKPGDTAIVYGESSAYSGYHVMYYVGDGELYSSIIAKNSLLDKDCSDWIEGLTNAYTVKNRVGMKLAAK